MTTPKIDFATNDPRKNRNSAESWDSAESAENAGSAPDRDEYPLTCPHCGRKFVRERQLAIHLQTDHAGS